MRLLPIFVYSLICVTTLVNGCLISRKTVHSTSPNVYQIRNFDFPIGGDADRYGELVLNPRGYQRMSLRKFPEDRPLNWTATHGSVTFNLLGENFPQGGMNEAGLAMQVTVLGNLYFPRPTQDSRPTITEMDVIQYVLDNAATIKEAKSLFFNNNNRNNRNNNNPDSKVRMVFLSSVVDLRPQVYNFHWGLCDPSGRCAMLEYLHDNFVWTEYEPNEPFIVTNNDDGSLRCDWDRLDREHNLPFPQWMVSKSSFPRYANARWLLFEQPSRVRKADHFNVTELFKVLDRATVHSWNKWQTVFDLTNRTFHYRTRPSLHQRTIYFQDWIKEGRFDQYDVNTTTTPHTKQQRIPLTCRLHVHHSDCLDFSTPADLETVKTDFETVALLMNQSESWADHAVAEINETRQVNLGQQGDWTYSNFMEVGPHPWTLQMAWAWAKLKTASTIRKMGYRFGLL